jgi:hypothetical protein
MDIFESKAQLIAAEMEKAQVEKHIVIDVMMVITIVKVIAAAVQMYKNCQTPPATAADSMRSGGLLERWRLRKVIRAQIDDEEMHAHVGVRMLGSILHVSSTLTDSEVEQMYKEVGKH